MWLLRRLNPIKKSVFNGLYLALSFSSIKQKKYNLKCSLETHEINKIKQNEDKSKTEHSSGEKSHAKVEKMKYSTCQLYWKQTVENCY